MKRILYYMEISLIALFMLGCTLKTDKPAGNLSPEETVRQYFKCWNDKDTIGMEKLITPDRKGITWEMNELKYVKLQSIKGDQSNYNKNTKVFLVEFEIKSRNGVVSGLNDGGHTWSYIVKRSNENSPWLISDWGV